MQRYRKGFTPIELLVVIGIILILVGILVPVLIRAKASSFQTNDISNLRQMAVAGSLYEQEYASPALGSAPLVAVGLIPKSICTSALDPTRNCLANEVASIFTLAMTGHDYLRRDYRVSYLGLWDYVYSESWMEKYVANFGNPGWLVSGIFVILIAMTVFCVVDIGTNYLTVDMSVTRFVKLLVESIGASTIAALCGRSAVLKRTLFVTSFCVLFLIVSLTPPILIGAPSTALVLQSAAYDLGISVVFSALAVLFAKTLLDSKYVVRRWPA